MVLILLHVFDSLCFVFVFAGVIMQRAGNLREEKQRLSFLIEKKTKDLQRLKEEEKFVLHQLISYRDQLKQIEQQEKQTKWQEDEKRKQQTDKKRHLMLQAIEKRSKHHISGV